MLSKTLGSLGVFFLFIVIMAIVFVANHPWVLIIIVAIIALVVYARHREKKKSVEALLYFKIEELDSLAGTGFEELLELVFTALGYGVSTTPATGDQGADLILSKDGRKISVQAKRYSGNIGNSAVQEVHSSINFYGTDEGWVVSSSEFTNGAKELAKRTGVRLYNRNETMNLIKMAHDEIQRQKT